MKRQITVYEAAQNGKVTVLENVEATTLGDLKSVFTAKGINFTNMDFMEGVSNTTLNGDDSILPSNMMYKGTATNDLFIYLSLKNKKIASGAYGRKELYRIIKENNLSDDIKKKFNGKNFTQVSTEELANFVSSISNNNANEEKKHSVGGNNTQETFAHDDNIVNRLKMAVSSILECLYDSDLIDGDGYHRIEDILSGAKIETKEDAKSKSVFNDDINNLVNRLRG